MLYTEFLERMKELVIRLENESQFDVVCDIYYLSKRYKEQLQNIY